MAQKFKSKDDIAKLAAEIKQRRLERRLTLKDIEVSQGINCAQISRIESAGFKTNSQNLQKLCQYLQIKIAFDKSLGERIEQFALRSAKHRAAAEDLLKALERLS
jgi:transcriptional regulator with XRE-family HTH domain